MTDNELNALVAERVMGWKRSTLSIRQPANPMLGTWVNNSGNVESMVESMAGGWTPASDMSAAWRVIKHFQSRGFGWRIQLEPDCRTWRVCNHDDGLFLAGWEEKHGYISVTATTAPLAICLAALDAVGVTVEVRAGISMTWDISQKDHDELRGMFGV